MFTSEIFSTESEIRNHGRVYLCGWIKVGRIKRSAGRSFVERKKTHQNVKFDGLNVIFADAHKKTAFGFCDCAKSFKTETFEETTLKSDFNDFFDEKLASKTKFLFRKNN